MVGDLQPQVRIIIKFNVVPGSVRRRSPVKSHYRRHMRAGLVLRSNRTHIRLSLIFLFFVFFLDGMDTYAVPPTLCTMHQVMEIQEVRLICKKGETAFIALINPIELTSEAIK